MICTLVGLSLQSVEAVIQRPASPMGDKKGKQVLDEPEKVSKAEKRQRCLEETPIPKVAVETTSMVGEAMLMTKEALEAPRKVVETSDEVANIMEIGCSTITTIDLAMSGLVGPRAMLARATVVMRWR